MSDTAPARATLDAAMTEEEWQAQVLELARAQGWLCYHTRDSRRSEPGFPDLVMVRGAQLIFLELKSHKGTAASVEQKEWMGRLKQVRYVHADIARPKDWPEIETALKARTR